MLWHVSLELATEVKRRPDVDSQEVDLVWNQLRR
jgi:hypothetical protein